MIEFDDKDLRDLQDVDGILLQDVHGQRVAIGKGFDYENIFQFMSAYFSFVLPFGVFTLWGENI